MSRRRNRSHYRAPGRFSKDTVRDMLTRPFYTGKNPYYGSHFDGEKVVKHPHPQELFDGRHVPLISEDLFFRCHAIRLNRGQAPQGGKENKRRRARIYLLSGLLDFARCGAPMIGQAGGRNHARRYACSNRIQRKACDQPSMLARIPEAQIIEQLAAFSFPEQWESRVLAFMLDEGGNDVLERQREVLDDNFAIVREQYECDEISRRAYLQAMHAYQHRLQELDPASNPQVDQEEVQRLLSNPALLWESATLREQRGLLQTMLKHARVDGKRVVEIKWYPPFERCFNGGRP